MAGAWNGRAAGLACGLAAALAWGSWAAISKLGVSGALDFQDVVALRYGVSGVILAPVVAAIGWSRQGLGGVAWPVVAVMVVAAGVPYALIVYAGFETAPAGHQAIIGPAGGVLSQSLLAWWLLGERLGRAQLAGLAAMVGGVVAIGWQSLAGATFTRGHVLLLIAAPLWGVFAVVARMYRVEALRATAIVAVLSAALYLPVYFALHGARLFDAPAAALVTQAVYQGAIAGVAALIVYMRAVTLLGVAQASLFTALVPAMAPLAIWALIGEEPTLVQWLGVALVTSGMVVAIFGGLGPGRAAAAAGQNAGLVPGSKPLPGRRG